MEKQQILQKIKHDVEHNVCVLYMKGTKMFPQCGFSSTVVSILTKLGIDFLDINVLEDPLLREAIKEFSNWPTVPQLYYQGNFVGGCDIVREMYQNGELQELMAL